MVVVTNKILLRLQITSESVIDREERGGNVIRLGNLQGRCFLVNLGALIPKIHVIQGFRGAFALDCNLKPRFGAILYKTISTGYKA